MLEIIGTFDNINKDYWVYMITDKSDNVLFINYAKMSDIIAFRPLMALPEFDMNEVYKITLIESTDNIINARNKLSTWIKKLMLGYTPKFNLLVRGYNNNRKIRCIETGVIYNNASDICSMSGVHQGNLSSHLARKAGFKTVKGLSYEYV